MQQFSSYVRVLLTAFALCANVAARADGYVSLTYQNIHINGFKSTVGKLDIGTTDTHNLILEAAYELGDRWTVTGAIPFVRKRYQGPAPHQPAALADPPDSEFVDDGSWHSDFQDWQLGLHYLAVTGPLTVEPFIGYSSPISDYPFFGHAAVGQHIWHFEVGANFTYLPGLSDFFFIGSPSYVFAEKTLGQNINHWRLNLSAGYRFTNDFSARVLAVGKDGNGLEFPDDFPPPRDTELWYLHDRLVKHNYVNVGVGADWRFAPKQSASIAWMRMVHADQVHIMKHALSLTYSRAF